MKRLTSKRRKVIGLGSMIVIGVLLMAILCCGCSSQNNSKRGNATGEREDIAESDNTEQLQEVVVPLTVINDTGVDIWQLYASITQTDDWEEDILGDDILYAGESMKINFTMQADTLVWDFAICDGDDNMLEFYDLDFSDCSVDGAVLYLEYDGENAYATLE